MKTVLGHVEDLLERVSNLESLVTVLIRAIPEDALKKAQDEQARSTELIQKLESREL